MGLKWDNIKRHQKLPLLLHAGRQWLAPTWVLPTAGLGTQRLCWVTFSALHCAHKTKRLRSEQALPFWSRSLWAQSTRPSLSLSLLAKTHRQNELNLSEGQSLADSSPFTLTLDPGTTTQLLNGSGLSGLLLEYLLFLATATGYGHHPEDFW